MTALPVIMVTARTRGADIVGPSSGGQRLRNQADDFLVVPTARCEMRSIAWLEIQVQAGSDGHPCFQCDRIERSVVAEKRIQLNIAWPRD